MGCIERANSSPDSIAMLWSDDVRRPLSAIEERNRFNTILPHNCPPPAWLAMQGHTRKIETYHLAQVGRLANSGRPAARHGHAGAKSRRLPRHGAAGCNKENNFLQLFEKLFYPSSSKERTMNHPGKTTNADSPDTLENSPDGYIPLATSVRGA